MRNISVSVIKECVAKWFRLEPEVLEGRLKKGRVSQARQVAMYLIRQHTDYTLAEIGMELGGRSPATVTWGYQRIASDIQSNPVLQRQMKRIKKSMRECRVSG